jgi:hypothetical protein
MGEEKLTIDEVQTENEALDNLLENSPTERLELTEEYYLWINDPPKGMETI